MEIDWTLFWACFLSTGAGALMQAWSYRKAMRQRGQLIRLYRLLYEATGTPTPFDGYITDANVEFIKGFISVGEDALDSTGVISKVYTEHEMAHNHCLERQFNGRQNTKRI